MAEELAVYTGLDRRTAEAGLQEVLNALGGQVSAGKQPTAVEPGPLHQQRFGRSPSGPILSSLYRYQVHATPYGV